MNTQQDQHGTSGDHQSEWLQHTAVLQQPSASADEKAKALEQLHQLLERVAKLPDKVGAVLRVVECIQAAVNVYSGHVADQSSPGVADLLLSAYQFLAKINVPSLITMQSSERMDPRTDRLSCVMFDLCFAALSKENEANAKICSKTLSYLIKLRRSIAHHCQSGPVYESQVEKVVKYFINRLDGLPALWQQKLSNAAAQQKERIDNPSKSRHSDSKTQDGTHIPATASIKVLFEMHIAVTNCLTSQHQVAKVLGAQLWPLLLRGMSIQYTELPPHGVLGATYSHLCEDLASLQTRLLQLVVLLSPSKLACAPTDSPELVDHIIRILHTAPVAASTNRDLLLHARSILLSGLKLPHEHQFSQHIRGRLLDLIDSGRLFARQRVDSHQVYARMLINDVVNLARTSLSVQQMNTLLEVYVGDLLDDSLSLAAQVRSVDLVHKLLETQCAAIRGQASIRDIDPGCRRLFSLCLRGLLRKLEYLAYQGSLVMARVKAAQQAGSAGETTARTVGVKNAWVGTVSTMASNVLPSRSEPSKDLDMVRSVSGMCLRTLTVALSGLNKVAAIESSSAPSLTPEELRLLGAGLHAAGQCIKIVNTQASVAQATPIAEHFAQLMLTLNYNVFADMLFNRFNIFFDVILEEDHVMMLLPHMLKSGRDNPRPAILQKHSAILHAILQHVTYNELNNLSDSMDRRTSITIRLCELALKRLTDVTFTEMHLQPIIPTYHDLVVGCLDNIRTRSSFNCYLTILRLACKIVTIKPMQVHRMLIDHLLVNNVTARMLHLLLELLKGPLGGTTTKDYVVELLMRLPCDLKDLIEQDKLGNLTKPLLMAFQSENPEVVLQAFSVMEHWTDSLTPSFLEPRMKGIMPELLEALTGYVTHARFGNGALQLLGKLGGRSYQHINGPQQMENHTNNEHGLRPVIFFKPSTSCVVPMDACLQFLVRERTSAISNATKDVREHAFQFVESCLNRVLQLDGYTGVSADYLEGKISNMLRSPESAAPAQASMPGSKPVTQYIAEEQRLEDMIIGAIIFCSDSELADQAKAYVRAIATHVSLVFVLRKASSQQELGIAGCWSSTPPRSPPQSRFGMTHLNMLVAVRSFATALVQERPAETAAACHALEVLVDSIVSLAAARPAGSAAEEATAKLDVDEKCDMKQAGSASAAAGSAGGNGRSEDGPRDDGSKAMGPPPAQKPRAALDSASKLRFQLPLTPPSLQASLPAVLDDLMAFVLHTCYGDSWAARIGGAAGLGVLIKRLPGVYIKPWAPQLCGAFNRVLAALPEHATKEITSMQGILQDLAVKIVRSIVPPGHKGHPEVMEGDSDKAPPPVSVLEDYDVSGLLDQIATSLFSQFGAPTLRDAGVGILGELYTQFGLTPTDVIGERLQEPHISFPSLSIFFKYSSQAKRTGQMQRIILVRSAISNAQILAAYARVTPTVIQDPSCVNECVKEALRIMHMSDEDLVRMFIVSRDNMTQLKPCDKLRAACLDFLCAILLQPIWRHASSSRPLLMEILDVLAPLVRHESQDLAEKSFDALMKVKDEVVADEELKSKLLKALSTAMHEIGVAQSPDLSVPDTAPIFVAQRLNSTGFIAGLHRMLQLAGAWAPDELGLALVYHLNSWMKPSDIMRSMGEDIPLPKSWCVGDEFKVPPAVLDLFHLLPPSSRDLLQTAKSGERDRHGLVVLTIELEQVLEKQMLQDTPSQSLSSFKLWSNLRPPLLRFLCRHLKESAHYFLSMDDARLFKPDYFWLLYDLALHDAGEELLDAVCASAPLWEAILDHLARDIGGPVTKHLDESSLRVLRLMAAIVERRPGWLQEQATLWPKVLALWKVPARAARLGAAPTAGCREHGESAMIARLVLSYIDRCRSELWRICDLFSILGHRASSDKLFLIKYASEELITDYSIDQQSSLVRYMFENLNSDQWPECDKSVMLRHIIIPLFKHAHDKGSLPDMLQGDLVDVVFQAVCSQQSAKQVEQHLPDNHIRCMCEAQRALQLVMESIPATRWSKHCKHVMELCWNVLRMRHEEVLMDITFLTAAKYFNLILPLNNQSMRKRLNRHLLHFYVTLLRTAATDHDHVLLFEAVHTMLPYMDVYNVSVGNEDGPMGPTYVNYVRKTIMDQLESLNPPATMCQSIAHVWRIVISYADQFYPHMAHLDTQLIACMQRMISTATSGMENWPVVVEMGLCIVHWLRNLFAGRPCDALPAPAGSKRPRTSDPDTSQRAGARQRTDASADVTRGVPCEEPAEGAAAADEQLEGSLPKVEPGTAEAAARLDAVKLPRVSQEMLFNIFVRIGLCTDRHGSRPKVQNNRSMDNQNSAKIWARAMLAVKELHELLPTAAIRVLPVMQKTMKEVQDSPETQLSMISTLLQIAATAPRAPGLLDEVLAFTCKRLPLVFKSSDMAMVADLCSLVRVLRSDSHAGDQTAGRAQFHSEVMHRMMQQLKHVAEHSDPGVITESVGKTGIVLKAPVVIALHILDAVLTAGGQTEQVLELARMLPAIYHVFAQFLRTIGSSHRDLVPMLSPELPLKAGGFLHTFRLLQTLMQRDNVMLTVSAMSTDAVNKLVTSIENIFKVFVNVKMPPEMAPEIVTHIFSLMDRMMQTTLGQVLRDERSAQVLRFVAQAARHMQTQFGFAPPWTRDIEQLLYRICVNEGGKYPASLAEEAFQIEHDLGSGLGSEDAIIRAKFRDMYDRKMGETRRERLLFIVREQAWINNAHNFWVRHALGLMLTLLDTDRRLLMAKTACQGVPVVPVESRPAEVKQEAALDDVSASIKPEPSGRSASGALEPLGPAASEQMPALPADVSAPELTGTANELVKHYAKYLHKAASGKVAQLVTAMYECGCADDRIARHLFVCILPMLWAACEQQDQLQLARPVVHLLTKMSDKAFDEPGSTEMHPSQVNRAVPSSKALNHIRVMKVLMDAVHMFHPQPKIAPEMIKFLGKCHASWHIGIAMLESHLLISPDEPRHFHALTDLCKAAHEQDLAYGIWKARCCRVPKPQDRGGESSNEQQPGLSEHDRQLGNALTLVQLGHWPEAASSFAQLNRFYAEMYQQASASTQLQGTPPQHNSGKAQLNIEEWILCMKQLNRWDELHQVATSCGNPQLKVECEWRLSMQDQLAATIKSASLGDTPENGIAACYSLALSDRSHELFAQTKIVTQRLQHEWSLLPSTAIDARIAMLQKTSQFVEVNEGAKVVQEIKHLFAGNTQPPPDAQFSAMWDTCETWRLRLPSAHDSMLHWATIVHWRSIIYDFMIQYFMPLEQNNANLYSLGFRDKSRSVNIMARAARKHGLPMLANHVINTMYRYPTMEVSEAFTKIQEQCKAYVDAKDHQAMGLTLINNTNLEYFPTEQQAAMFRLQGMLFEAMDDNAEQAAQLYFTALHIHDADAQSWLVWGKLCAAKAEKHAQDIAKGRGMEQSQKDLMRQLMSKQQEYTENAVACFFTALRIHSAYGPFLVPHLLAILSHNSFANPSPLHPVVKEELQQGLPAQVLLPHISHLVEGLTRGERDIAKWLLRHVAVSFPQAAYCPLRVGVYHARDSVQRWIKEHDNSGEGDTASKKQEAKNLPERWAFEMGRDLFDTLRMRQQLSACNLERFISEVITRFNSRPEERLYNVVYTLLQRCLRLPRPQSADVPDDMKRELQNVCDACLAHEMQASGRRRGMPVEMRQSFVNDVQPSTKTSLRSLMESLKKWLTKLREMCDAKFPALQHLVEEFPMLAALDCSDLELPGQFQQADFVPDETVFVESIGSHVRLMRRHGVTLRRIEFICSDGNSRFFAIYSGQLPNTSDARVMGVYRSANWLLRKHPEARRRNLQLYAPIIVSLWPQARMVQEEPSCMTLADVYDLHCESAGREPERIITFFKEGVHKYAEKDPSTPMDQHKLRAFTDIVSATRTISDQILSKYMFKSLPTASHVFLFRKQFAAQAALTSLFSYLFSCMASTPHRFVFARASGAVYLQDMAVHYNQEVKARNADMPYRMTRNMSSFISQYGIEGWFLVTQALASQSMTGTKQNLKWALHLFFRDDVFGQNRKALKSRAKSVDEMEHAHQRLGNVMLLAVQDSFGRLQSVAGVNDSSGAILKARALHKAATSPKNLAVQDPVFHPWF